MSDKIMKDISNNNNSVELKLDELENVTGGNFSFLGNIFSTMKFKNLNDGNKSLNTKSTNDKDITEIINKA